LNGDNASSMAEMIAAAAGMTPTSLVPDIARHVGIGFDELVAWAKKVPSADVFGYFRGNSGNTPFSGLSYLRAWGVEANTDEQVMCIKTKVAQRIMEYATEGEHDVEHLKEFGLQGLPHLCAHRVGLSRRYS